MDKSIILLLTACLAMIPVLAAAFGDGTPEYRESVGNSYRNLQVRTSIYQTFPKKGAGIRLGIYQAQADSGPGATAKNMARLEFWTETWCHPLKGSRQGQYSVKLTGFYRLIFTLRGDALEIALIEEVSKHYGE